MPLNREFGRRFAALLAAHGLKGEEQPYVFLDGLISKSTIRNWKKGSPAPDPASEMDRERVTAVIGKFPGEKPEEWLAVLESRDIGPMVLRPVNQHG